jgi:hypothetical protein
MRIGICVFLIISCALIFISCNTTEPPPPDGEKPTLALTLEDVSCTEAWIELTTTNLQLPTTVTLKQFNPTGDTLSQDIILNTQDSLLYIDTLLPNTNYSYQSFNQSINQSGMKSNVLGVTTLDTTSNNFTFETFTFGGTAGSSVLSDVAIISPDNVWCVGEILVADTSQNGYTMYNAVHWDGVEWELKRIPYYDYGGYLVYGPLQTVFAFDENDVWFCSYANLLQYNGSEYLSRAFFMTSINFDGQVMKMWGSDGNNIYCVGRNGAIYHYYGNGWTRTESGTDLIIRDVWGVNNKNISHRKVFCTVLSSVVIGQHKILTIDENNVVDSLHWDTGRIVTSSWTKEGHFVYTSGWGVFNNKSGKWEEERSIPLFYTNRIRGSALNNIIVVGNYGFLAHYNGAGWKVYDEFLQLSSADFYSVSVEGDIMAAVGYNGESGLIVIGRKN